MSRIVQGVAVYWSPGTGEGCHEPATASSLIGMPEPLTTIKVPKSLRARISALAGQRHRTAAEVIEELLDEADRRARFDAVRAAYESADSAYLDETEAWDSLAADGLRS